MGRKKTSEKIKPETKESTEGNKYGEQFKGINAMDLFARKPERGVVVMTKEASGLSDATRPKTVPKGPSKNITSIKKKP